MEIKENAKKLGKILGVGALWVYVLSIPYNGRLIFDEAYDVLVDNSVVHAIAREAKVVIHDARTKAIDVLDDNEPDVAKAKRNAEGVTEEF